MILYKIIGLSKHHLIFLKLKWKAERISHQNFGGIYCTLSVFQTFKKDILFDLRFLIENLLNRRAIYSLGFIVLYEYSHLIR